MRAAKTSAFALALILTIGEGNANAQGVAYYPVVGVIPDGVTMSVTPVASADRRYVRLAVNPNFIAVSQFDTFPVPGAVGGGGLGGPGALAGLGGLGLGGGGLGGGNNAVGGGGGFRQMGLGPNPFDPLLGGVVNQNGQGNDRVAQVKNHRREIPRRKATVAKRNSPTSSGHSKASTLIRAGEQLEKAGKPWAALENYRQVVREHSDDPLARIAEKKLADLR